MPLLGPTLQIKLCMVYCTVELKVVGNLECRIKFYRKKKPRHFFYAIEYPYPPTNSALTEIMNCPDFKASKSKKGQQKLLSIYLYKKIIREEKDTFAQLKEV
jgi:hypothetical protein